MSGLEGLAGTPDRVASPGVPAVTSAGGGGLDDLMGMGWESSNGMNGSAGNDLTNGFGALDMNEDQPPPPQQQVDAAGQRKTNQDLLDLF